MEETTRIVYQNITKYCDVRDIPVSTFERFCGIGNGVVKDWSGNGKNTSPTLKTLDKIQAATGITVGYWIKKGGIESWSRKGLEA